MLKKDKLDFEKSVTTHYLKGIGASLLTSLVTIGIVIGYFIFGTRRIFSNRGFLPFDIFTTSMFLILVICLLLTLIYPWRKYKRKAIHYYNSNSDEFTYDEWYSRLIKHQKEKNVVEREGYVNLFMWPNHQISITKSPENVKDIVSEKKNHLILLYTASCFDENVFDSNDLRKRVIVYNKQDSFTYEKREPQYYTFKRIISNAYFESFKAGYTGYKRFKLRMIPEFIIIWLFQMF